MTNNGNYFDYAVHELPGIINNSPGQLQVLFLRELSNGRKFGVKSAES